MTAMTRLGQWMLICAMATPALAQKDSVSKRKDRAPKPADSTKVSRFFESETPITATLTLNIKQITHDKGDNAPWRAATLAYVAADSTRVTVPVRVRTRGIWRLKTCEFPPLRLNFTSEAVKKTVFHGLDKPKLVNYCRNDDQYEEYLLQEFQLYRVYRVLTPASHAVRLLRLSYVDSASGKPVATRHAFIEEDPDALAARMGGKMLKEKGAGPDDYEPFADALVGVFQYLIGNTDFALNALHNAELLGLSNGQYIPVVYDFDFSGAVNAKYATVDPKIRARTVRERVYRGFCVPAETYPKVFARFDERRNAIYSLYKDSLGALLKPDVLRETLKYFDEFYETIDHPKSAKSEIVDQCLGKK
jgi:hypothetical protein